jgi:hypothetical protein
MTSLGEPFYIEKGKITGPYTYTANGILRDAGMSPIMV